MDGRPPRIHPDPPEHGPGPDPGLNPLSWGTAEPSHIRPSHGRGRYDRRDLCEGMGRRRRRHLFRPGRCRDDLGRRDPRRSQPGRPERSLYRHGPRGLQFALCLSRLCRTGGLGEHDQIQDQPGSRYDLEPGRDDRVVPVAGRRERRHGHGFDPDESAACRLHLDPGGNDRDRRRDLEGLRGLLVNPRLFDDGCRRDGPPPGDRRPRGHGHRRL
ncbi:MAG: hypothetical protein MZV63_64555 [Marinilabiliales bacterium]|nr:hypothetical protein [Marinilabiliales bacterium]